MLNKIAISLILLTTPAAAILPPLPNLPNLPMFGDFNPNQLRRNFNTFVNGSQPDFARESRIISEIEDSIVDGDVEYLSLKNGRKVFSIYMQSEAEKPHGGVIILHNRGHHANWNDTIHPLRVGLSEKGWDTLSVQMPILDKHAKYYDYVPIFPYAHRRIEAAIEFYQKLGIKNISLIAHGCGAHMSMSYLDKIGDKAISNFVGIGMGATDYQQKLVKPYPLATLKIPVLDIFAQNDFAGVLRLAKSRKPKLNSKSKQILIADANHYYQENGAANRLIDEIAAWLTQKH
ncbi:MAG: DUF3530 family protein [Candidatus Thioglobus sp.]|nr:DUF3530 family protein [Candidatus Thioglobus sp.]